MATPVKTRSTTAKLGTTAAGKATSGKAVGKSSATTTPQANPAKPRGMFFGLMVLFLGMEVISIGISYLNVATKGALSHPVYFTLPLLGPVVPITFIFIGAAVLLYYVMLRFKLLPTRQSLQQQSALTASPTRSGTKAGAVATPPPAPSMGSVFGGMFGGLFGGNKAATTATATATPKTTSSAGSKTATAGRPLGKAKMMTVKVREETVDADADPNDEAYNQVKAQLRTQARKKRKH